MKIEELIKRFDTPARIDALSGMLSDRKLRRIALRGLAGSSAAVLLAGLPRRRAPYLVIADDADSAGYLYNDLCRLNGGKGVAILPSGYKRDIRYGQPDPPQQILRTDALEAWDRRDTRWVVSYPEAMAEKVAGRDKLADSTVAFRTGATIAMSDVCSRLRDLGFSETDYVYEPGQFARRGSILDVFSYSCELPYRIDFFDDEIDSIRTFNVETQLSESRLKEASVVGPLEQDAGQEISFLEFVCGGERPKLFCQSAGHLLARIREIAAGTFSESAMLADEGDRDSMSHVVDPDGFESTFRELTVVEYGNAQGGADGFEPQATLDFGCTPQALYHKNFELISESFRRLISEGYKLHILTESEKQAERLRSIFADRGDDIPFTSVEGTLHEGFTDNATRNCFFTDHQIFDRFHKYSLRSEKARGGKLALSIKELNRIEAGDYIVHVDHGIGRFGGLVRTDVNGRTQEMIKLIYQNDDIIFVSIHSLHKLSKYRGKEGVPPKINKLGTGAWNRLKERTKTKMKDIARDLIKLYAARREERGHAFAPDSYMQHELEASFIYEDTPDQLRATQAVKADMESARPMDRLICGDVGFGKTEIAIRAAFKAAADNKQTAVLVPTTVLALQHYHTFSERLRDFPVRVELLSRARKQKEVKQILADLAAGKIDILIGTHKIIGKGVEFKDLGLLVIDEEQKFGVSVKEKLKQMKVNVDTLTMSATPIPRTLQFSLMGARDLSSINTPPANRHPIITTVSGFDDSVIAEAINFEMSRNGQVFVVCNRIEQLTELENRLKRIVPGVRIVVGHGQMPPEKLEKAIADFATHDYDVLLSTTIIESGVDMPNVNTIIVNNAQNFGLSELHQLRGRVGRSARKAFCYLLVPPGLPLTPVARRRLQAIESFSDLGSGIHIAMQDLDIRGAGNLLGAEQSGFIADLGYETYQKILKESVLELKTEEFGDTFADENAGQEEEFTADCTVESDMELLIPGSYVPQEGERIELYRRLDNMESAADVDRFRADLRDRFGELPAVTEELIRIVPLRIAAKRLGIEKLYLKRGQMYLYFVDRSNEAYYRSAAFGRVIGYLQAHPRRGKPRETEGKQPSMVFYNVDSVCEALSILDEMNNGQ